MGQSDIIPGAGNSPENASAEALFGDLSRIIEQNRESVASVVNAGLTVMYWQVGQRIRSELLQDARAEYGRRILHTLSAKLTSAYGRGWSERNLAYFVKFVEVFPDINILHTLCAKLSWSHFRTFIGLDEPLKRAFYVEMSRVERWSVRTLQQKINSLLYERTALSKKPDALISRELSELRESGSLTPDMVFRDPYFLDFLGLKDCYLEKDLETAILHELESFLLELGSGFAFLARQKRIQIDNEDYYIDLLFYHRSLNRLIAIDLKLGEFKAEYKGQMELYLRWLNKYERKSHENEPLGIILCSGKRQELVELMELGNSGIHVAEYLTELPPRAVLEEKLRKAIQAARNRIPL